MVATEVEQKSIICRNDPLFLPVTNSFIELK